MNGTTSLTRYNSPVILQGQSNYSYWIREFKAVLLSEGLLVLDLFITNEKALEKPTRPTAPNPNDFKTYADSAEEAQGKRNAFTDKTQEYTIAIETYKLDTEDYNRQQNTFAKAKGLLALYTDPALRNTYSPKDTPHQMIRKLSTAYRMSATRTFEQAMNDMESLTLYKCKSMTDYFNQIAIIRLEIKETSNTTHWSDDQTI